MTLEERIRSASKPKTKETVRENSLEDRIRRASGKTSSYDSGIDRNYVNRLTRYVSGADDRVGSAREYFDYLKDNEADLRSYMGTGSYDLAFKRLNEELIDTTAAKKRAERGVYSDAPNKGIAPRIAVDIGLRRSGAIAPNNPITAAPNDGSTNAYAQAMRRTALEREKARLNSLDNVTLQELADGDERMAAIDLALGKVNSSLANIDRAGRVANTERKAASASNFDEMSKRGADMSDNASAQWRLVNDNQGVQNATMRGNLLQNIGKAANNAVTGGNLIGAGDRMQARTLAEQDVYAKMTGNEREVYNYLYATQGAEAADAYLADLKQELSERRTADVVKEAQSLASGNVFESGVANAASVAGTLDGGLAYAEAALRKAMGQDIDLNDPMYDAARLRSSIRDTTSQNISQGVQNATNSQFLGDAASFVYQTGMSMADSLVAAGLSAVGGGAVGATMLAGSAANDTMMQAKERGASDNQALVLGGLAGVAEALFEKIPLDEFLKEASPAARGAIVRNILRQAGIEAGEEGATEVANIITDALVMGDQSQYANMSAWELAGQVALSALGGALSGAPMGALASGYSSARATGIGKSLQKQGVAGKVVQDALGSSDVAVSSLARDVRDGRAKMGARNVGRLYAGMQQADERMQSTGDALRDAAMQRAVEQEKNAQPTQTAQEPVQEASAELEEEYTLPETNAPAVAQQRKDAAVSDITGESINVDGIDSVEDGAVYVMAGEEKIPMADVQFADPRIAALYNAASEFDTATAQRFVAGYDGGDVQQYIQSFTSVYKDGQAGVPYETTLKQRISAQNLTENQRIDAYTGGMASNKPTVNAAKLKPGLTRSYTKASLSREAASALKKHRRQIEAIDVMAKKYGRKVVLVSSLEGMTIGGETITSAVNGAYDRSTGIIYIAADAQDGAFAYVAMHEMVHSIRKDSADNFNRLRDTVFEALEAAGEDVDALIDYQINSVYKGKIDRDGAIEEVIANTAPTVLTDEAFVRNLYANDRTLFDKIREFFEDLKKVFAELTQSGSWSQDAALNEESVRKIADVFDEVAKGDLSQEGVVTNENGEAVAYSDGNGGLRFSEKTYREGGRSTLERYLKTQVKKRALTKQDADDILRHTDDVYKTMQLVGKGFETYSNWADAEVVVDDNGNPVFSVVKANGDYAMNLDFSLVCKKRRTLDAVFNEMIARGIIDNFDLEQTEIVQINDIIREHGFETACALCFVDAKRFRQAKVADDFVEMYNRAVRSMAGDKLIDSFNFGGDTTVRRTAHGIDKLPNDQLDFTYINDVLKSGDTGTVEYKIAAHLKKTPADRKLVARGDFMSSRGFDVVKRKNPEVLKLYNSKKGSGGPKAAFGDVQYLSEIVRKRTFNAKKAFAVGGVRVQSFSDYVPRLVFDYVQMIGDLAAKQLPAHSYTKEELFVKQFGLTGMKINMSLIPAVVDGAPAGLDADGNYVWAKESFDYDTAVEIQNDPAYGRNCGTICVGVSEEHIRKLMADPSIRMVIPYHKSGLNPLVAQMNKIDAFSDYTDTQNTRYASSGSKLSDADRAKEPNFNERLHKLGADGDPRAVVEEYVRWCERNDYLPKFDEFTYVRDTRGRVVLDENGQKTIDPNYYKLIEDFTVYDGDGNYVPQDAVRAVYPNDGAAFGSMTDLIKRGLEEDQALEDMRTENVGGIVDEISRTLKPKKGLKLSVRDQYVSDYDKWVESGRPDHTEIMVGTTSNVLIGIGAKEQRVILRGEDAKHALRHDNMDDSIMKRVPYVVEDPVLVMKSKQIAPKNNREATRLVIYGDEVSNNGYPVAVIYELKVKGGEGTIRDIQLIQNAYGKDHSLADQIRSSEIVFLNGDKKRTDAWLHRLGLQLPSRKATYGSIGSIAYEGNYVKINGTTYDDWANGVVKTSRKDTNQRIYDTRTAERIAEGRKQAAAQQKADARMEAQQERADARIAALEARIRVLEQQVKDERAAGQVNTAVERKAGRQAVEEARTAERIAEGRIRSEERQRAAERLEAQKQRDAEKLREVREQRDQKLQEQRWTYQDRIAEDRANRRERDEQTKYRERIMANAKTLTAWLTRPTDEKHVPESMRKVIAKFLETLEWGDGTKRTQKGDLWRSRLMEMLLVMERIDKAADEGQALDIDPDLTARMEEFLGGVPDTITSIGNLNTEQLRDLDYILQTVKRTVVYANRTRANKLYASVSAIGDAAITEMDLSKGKSRFWQTFSAADKFFNIQQLDSFSFFAGLGEVAESILYELRDGFDAKIKHVQQAVEYVKPITKGLKMREISGKQAKLHTFQLNDGEVKMTTAQIMELYELLKREQARGHIFGSGIRIADISRGKLAAEVKQLDPVQITVEEAQTIVDSLTDQQKQLADRLAWFMGNECAAWGNETSVLMYGYKKFTEQNYYPIHSDSNFILTNDKNDKGQQGAFAALKNLGMTKQVQKGAHNPIIVGDIFDTFTQHVDDMASYNGMMPALSDAMKWYNFKAESETGKVKSVKRSMERRAGVHAKGYFETLIKQLNGVNDRGERIGITNWLTNHAKAAAVGANLRVVLQQPSAYVRAAAVIDPKYLLKGFGKALAKGNRAMAKEYSPIALWKSWGYYDISIGKDMRSLLFNDSNIDERMREWSMAPAAWADEMTWGALFRACLAEQKDIHPDWSEDQQKAAAGRRLSEIVDLTQVVDSPFHKSQLMRSSDGLVRMQTSFMAEPTKTYNLLRTSLVKAIEKKDKASIKQFGRTAVTWLVSATVTAAFAAIADVGRDDDDDQNVLEKYGEALSANLIDNVNLLNSIPFVKDILSLLEGYEPSRLDMQAADKLINVGKVWLKQLNAEKGEKPYTHWYMAYQTAQAVSSITGIPVGNLMREVDAIASTFGADLKTKTSIASATERYEKLYGAIVEGKDAKVKRIEAALKEDEKSPKDIDSGIAKVLAEQDERIAEAYEARESGDIDTLDEIRDELAEVFGEETVDKALNLYGNSTEKEPSEKNLDEMLSAPLFDYADMEVVALQAFETGDTDALERVIAEIKADSDAQDPDRAVRTKATTLFKPVYLKAKSRGYVKQAARIKQILIDVFGMEAETIDKWKEK